MTPKEIFPERPDNTIHTDPDADRFVDTANKAFLDGEFTADELRYFAEVLDRYHYNHSTKDHLTPKQLQGLQEKMAEEVADILEDMDEKIQSLRSASYGDLVERWDIEP